MNTDYYIPQNGISIELNVDGEPNYVKVSFQNKAYIRAYIRDVIPYTSGEYASWTLTGNNTIFNTDAAKYVTVIIPQSEDVGLVAQLVFPSLLLDLYGYYINSEGDYIDEEGNPTDSPINVFGENNQYWCFHIGTISEVTDNARSWTSALDFGLLGTKEQSQYAKQYLSPSQLLVENSQGDMETVFDDDGFIKANRIKANTIQAKSVMAYNAEGVKLSAFNGNDNGTITYYYPNGNVMREDAFVYDSSGNVTGMRTYYYNLDGSLSWCLKEDGSTGGITRYWKTFNYGFVTETTQAQMLAAVKSWGLNRYTPMTSMDFSGIPTSAIAAFSQFFDTDSSSSSYPYNELLQKGYVDESSVPSSTSGFSGYIFYETFPYNIGQDEQGNTVMGFDVFLFSNGFPSSSVMVTADGEIFEGVTT